MHNCLQKDEEFIDKKDIIIEYGMEKWLIRYCPIDVRQLF